MYLKNKKYVSNQIKIHHYQYERKRKVLQNQPHMFTKRLLQILFHEKIGDMESNNDIKIPINLRRKRSLLRNNNFDPARRQGKNI